MSSKWPLVLLCLVSFSLSSAAQSNYPPADLLNSISADRIRAHMQFLADDLLEGRATGSRGYMIAAKYVAARFQEMGLKPAGDNGTYFQNVRFRQIQLDQAGTSMTVTRDGDTEDLHFAEDYVTAGNDLYPDSSVEGQLVFCGYGVTAPESKYDDYAGADVKDKIVVVFYGAPATFPTAQRAHYSSSTEKAANAAAHGASGLITIWVGRRTPFSAMVRYFRSPRMRWLDDKGQPNNAQPKLRGSALMNPESAAQLFEGAAKSLKQAMADGEAGKPQSFPLPVSVKLHIVSRHSEVESPNIAAILPGSDPKLKNEYILFSAHTDHLGVGTAVNGDSIYNGAIDNASGTAALLEMARAWSAAPKQPRRSIMFLAVTGEEEGLLGSDYYANYPTVPISQIIANLNMDEVSMFYDFRDVVALGAEHSSLGKIVDDVAKRMKLEVSPDPTPEEVFFVRSDQYSFVKKGVPAVNLFEGFKALDPKLDGKKITEEWEEKYYHSPQDDMKQPYLDFNAAAKVVRMNLAVAYEIDQQDGRPHWNKGDFFEKFAKERK